MHFSEKLSAYALLWERNIGLQWIKMAVREIVEGGKLLIATSQWCRNNSFIIKMKNKWKKGKWVPTFVNCLLDSLSGRPRIRCLATNAWLWLNNFYSLSLFQFEAFLPHISCGPSDIISEPQFPSAKHG